MTQAAIVALCIAASTPGPAAIEDTAPETGVSRLAHRLTTAITRRFEASSGTIVKVDGARAFVDVPDLAAGALLEWLEPEGDLLAPDDLSIVGATFQVCGRIAITGSNGTVSWGEVIPSGAPGCPPLIPGKTASIPVATVRIGIAASTSSPQLAGLLALLVEILPGRLERTGILRPTVLRESAAAPTLATPPEEAREALKRLDLDAVAVLRVAALGSRMAALVEIVAITPRVVRDVAEVQVELTPEALFRPPVPRERAARELAETALAGVVLDLAVLPGEARKRPETPESRGSAGAVESTAVTHVGQGPEGGGGEEGRASVLVLTNRALLKVRLEGTRLVLDTLEDTEHLPQAAVPTREPAGSLAVSVAGAEPRICFGSNLWSGGVCRTQSGRVAIDGVPFAVAEHILLARYTAGTNALTGELRDLDLPNAAIDVGPFLAMEADRAGGGGVLLLRTDGALERRRSDLTAPGLRLPVSGDGFAASMHGILRSARRPLGEPDALAGLGEDRPPLPVAGGIVRIVLADLDGDGRPELVLALRTPAGASRLALLGLD